MRYFDELAPRVIAHRLNLPARTVHTRLARGKQQLRALLEGKTGSDGRSAMAGLVALVQRNGRLTTATSSCSESPAIVPSWSRAF